MPIMTSAFRPLPELLFDAVELGFFTQQERCGPDPVNAFCAALCAAGHTTRHRNTRKISVSVPIPNTCSSFEAELFVNQFGVNGLVIGSGSTIRINPIRLLRSAMGNEAAGPPGLDGKTNVVGVTGGRTGELLPVQLTCVRAAIDALAEAINAALPSSAVWVAERFGSGRWRSALTSSMPGRPTSSGAFSDPHCAGLRELPSTSIECKPLTKRECLWCAGGARRVGRSSSATRQRPLLGKRMDAPK